MIIGIVCFLFVLVLVFSLSCVSRWKKRLEWLFYRYKIPLHCTISTFMSFLRTGTFATRRNVASEILRSRIREIPIRFRRSIALLYLRLEFYYPRDSFLLMCTFVDSFIVLYSYFNVTTYDVLGNIVRRSVARNASRFRRRKLVNCNFSSFSLFLS